MTHSTRKSYKEKWLEAKKAEDTRPLDQITDAARLIREANEYRSKETELIKELAGSVVELIGMMDHPDGKSVLRDEKDYRKPIDSHLPNFDNMLVLRRTRDVVRRATDRIGMLGLAAKDNETQVIDYRSVAQTLTKPTEAISRGIFSSYIVGPSPTVDEMDRALDNKGKNPRTIDYVYHTDVDDLVKRIKSLEEQNRSLTDKLAEIQRVTVEHAEKEQAIVQEALTVIRNNQQTEIGSNQTPSEVERFEERSVEIDVQMAKLRADLGKQPARPTRTAAQRNKLMFGKM